MLVKNNEDKKFKFTQNRINEMIFQQEQVLYWDTDLTGFGIRVGNKSKTYFVQGAINGKTVRVTIGKHPIFKLQAARHAALEILFKIKQGINPNEEKKEERKKKITLEQKIEEYLKAREKKLSPATIKGYRASLTNHFPDWANKSLSEITREMIEKRFEKLTKERGPIAANNSMDGLRAVFNFAAIDDENLSNPTDILRLKKLKNKKERRKTFIQDKDLKIWFEEVLNLQNDSIRDALILILFTGLRKMEAFSLNWENVDLENKKYLIPHTKNGIPLTLPMSDYVFELFQKRFSEKKSEKWIFPGRGIDGHLTDAKKAVLNIRKKTEVKFTIHDLRRTFATKGDSLSISKSTLKRLLNHAHSGDVTEGYIVPKVDDLRVPNQKITDAFLELVGR